MLSVFKVLTIVAELLQYALHCGKHTLDRKKQPSLKGAEYLLGLSRKNTPLEMSCFLIHLNELQEFSLLSMKITYVLFTEKNLWNKYYYERKT